MTLFDALLTTLEVDGGSIRGRTLLQKKLYFLSVLTREDFGFAPYHYGPYSSAVSEELETLVSSGFVEERKESLPMVNAGQFEPRQYTYALTKDGRAIIPSIVRGQAQYRDALSKINGHEVAKSIALLSVAAKIHIVCADGSELSADDIVARAKHLGWDLQPHTVSRALGYLEHLGLISDAKHAKVTVSGA